MVQYIIIIDVIILIFNLYTTNVNFQLGLIMIKYYI